MQCLLIVCQGKIGPGTGGRQAWISFIRFYLLWISNIFVQIVKYICSDLLSNLFRLFNIFVPRQDWTCSTREASLDFIYHVLFVKIFEYCSDVYVYYINQ